ncbi:hypothetical protein F5B21DRAFT_508284 [Xylaria acuta]|nr:hypothetical protein F5B21DRAFT_508284 [Xylaria acuta]
MTNAQTPRESADPYPRRGGRGGRGWRGGRGARGGRGQQARNTQLINAPTSQPIATPSPSVTSTLISPTPGSPTQALDFRSWLSRVKSPGANLTTSALSPSPPVSSKSQPFSPPKTLPSSQTGDTQFKVDAPSADAFCVVLKRFFNNEHLTDATIRCGNQEFKVHAVVFSVHSDFFYKAFCGQWKEGGDGKIIKLDEVEVDVVRAMIQFMYHFDYNTPDSVSALLFDAKVYSIAGRYLIPKLKDYSKAKFESAISCLLDSTGFSADLCAVVSEIYSCTPESDRGLRDIVAEAFHNNLSKLEKSESFHTSLSKIPGRRDYILPDSLSDRHEQDVDVAGTVAKARIGSVSGSERESMFGASMGPKTLDIQGLEA